MNTIINAGNCHRDLRTLKSVPCTLRHQLSEIQSVSRTGMLFYGNSGFFVWHGDGYSMHLTTESHNISRGNKGRIMTLPEVLHGRTAFQRIAKLSQSLLEITTGLGQKCTILGITGLVFLAISAQAKTCYVDSAATGANDGTSWASAWTSLSAIKGLAAGDTVYISGGASGSTRTYSQSGWAPAGGTASNPITYQIGQDSSHNGTALFTGSGTWLGTINNLIISGDAGDGGTHFALAASTNSASPFSVVISTTSSTHIRISYLNCGQMSGGSMSPFYFGLSGCTAIELDHIYLYITGAPQQGGFSALWNGNAAGYDQSKCHHNEVHLPNDGNGVGPDGLKWQQNGCSVYNNLFVTYFQTGASGDHQDGDQVQGGDYMKVYNNRVVDMANYAIFFEGSYGGFNHVQIYNNIAILTSSTIRSSAPPGGLVMGAAGTSTFTDVLIANNAVLDYGGHGAIALNNTSGSSATFSGCLVANNAIVNSGAPDLSGNSTTPSINNPNLTSATAALYFTSYTLGNASDNLHLTALASSLIGKGTNLTAWGITTDADGNARPASGAWDIGPYQYSVASVNPVISVSPGSLNFGSVLTNSTGSNLTLTVQNTGGGTLSGIASVTGPFSIVSGGTYSLGANQSQAIVIKFAPGSLGSASGTVTLTGGGGASASVTGTGMSMPPIVSAINQSASDVDPNIPGMQIYYGSVVQYSGSASDPNGLPLSWQWIYTVNGGSEVVFSSGTGPVLNAAFNYGAGAAGSTYVWKLRVSNGNATAESTLTVGVETPPLPAGTLTFPVTAGTITAPFIVTGTGTNAYISETADTGVTNGGQATFGFSITNAGNYVVQVSVNASTMAANSVYLNIDGTPQDPTMIWDIPLTSGFERLLAGQRGNGTFDNDQFAPKVFNLAAGTHQLIVVGREANVQMQSFSILQLPAPPQNLRVVVP